MPIGWTAPVYAYTYTNPVNTSESTTMWRPAGTSNNVTASRRLGTQSGNGTLLDSAGIGGTQQTNLTISNLRAKLEDANAASKAIIRY